jgi:fatty-acyl-CoA synthase
METASIVIKKIITYLPDGTREEYRFGDMYKRCKKLANALTKKIRINNGDMVGTLHGIMHHM